MKTNLIIYVNLLFLFFVFSCDLGNLADNSKNNFEKQEILENQRISQNAVTVYAKAKYKGKKVKLTIGKYNQENLEKAGLKNNDAESIKVAKKYKAELFDGNNFNGYSETISKNKKTLSKKLKNKVSSIIVSKIGTDDDDDDNDDDNNNDNNDDNDDDNNDDNDRKRIGFSNDGNVHDKDDIGASAFAVAIVAAFKQRYVHHDYSSHIPDIGRDGYMAESVRGAAKRFFNDESMCFSDAKNLQGAIDNITHQINISTAKDRFYYAIGGPCEVPWRGINASERSKRQFCTAIYHLQWCCGGHTHGIMKHKWKDIQVSGVVAVSISNQNKGFNRSQGAWDWLKTFPDPNVQWLETRMRYKPGDVSDAGMAWFICTGANDAKCTGGDQDGNPEKVKNRFEQVWGKK